MNTKEQIINEALRQFAEKGYAGTSMSDIAKPLDISKAALYKHFKGKQEIFDRIIEDSERRFDDLLENLSVHFQAKDAGTDPEDVRFYAGINPVKLSSNVLSFVRFAMTDPYSIQVRHMLKISQFQSRELGSLYTRRYVDTMLDYDTKLFGELMKAGFMKKDDPKQMALYFCAPVFMYMEIWDREPEKEHECMEAIRKHVSHFFEMTACER
ncbi:MAG: TetR/AcrR family transcriptional regulator [Clostridia bacterium]|nr:TetR/AcrR family transcriptional regulator [Clostridia bacterium]